MNNRYLSDIGKMDRTLTIRKRTVATVDRFNHPLTYTNTDTNVYAALSFDETQKTDETGQNTKETKTDILFFIIRYKSDLLITDQIVYSNQTYNIINIVEIGRRKFYKIKIELTK